MPYNKEQQKQYRKNKSKSGMSGQYYQWYKFIQTLNTDELHVLYEKRRKQCKYIQTEKELQHIKTEIQIILDVLEEKQQPLEKEQ